MEQMLAVIPRFFAGEGDWGNDYSKAAIFKFKVVGGESTGPETTLGENEDSGVARQLCNISNTTDSI